MNWIYDIAAWKMGVTITLLFSVVSVLLCAYSRDWVYRTFKLSDESNEAINGVFAGVGVLYGLLLGLVAVAAWSNYDDVETLVGKEASVIAALYRDVSVLEAPVKPALQAELKHYLEHTIDVAWEKHRQGITNEDGVLILTKIHGLLAGYEPHGVRQEQLFSKALDEFGNVAEARRVRIDAVTSGVPTVFWAAMLAGSFLMIALCFFFYLSSAAAHLFLTGMLSSLVGYMLFLVMAVDCPFRGDVSVSPAAYQDVLNDLDKFDPYPSLLEGENHSN